MSHHQNIKCLAAYSVVKWASYLWNSKENAAVALPAIASYWNHNQPFEIDKGGPKYLKPENRDAEKHTMTKLSNKTTARLLASRPKRQYGEMPNEKQ